MVEKIKGMLNRLAKGIGFVGLIVFIGTAWITKYKADQAVEENCAQEIRIRTCERDISALKVMVDRVVLMDGKLDTLIAAANRKEGSK